MKTIQTFALLVLLFAANTYSQDVIALEKEEGSIAIETKVPEALAEILNDKVEPEGEKLESVTDSSALQPEETSIQDIEVNSPNSPQREEEITSTIPEVQESSSLVSKSESSSKSPEEIPQTVAEETTLSESGPPEQASSSSDSPQKEVEIPAKIPDVQESSSSVSKPEPSTKNPEGIPPIVNEETSLSESVPAAEAENSSNSPQKEKEIQAPIPDVQESSSTASKPEASTESPEETSQIVDEETILSESEPEVQAVNSSDRPQKEEETPVTISVVEGSSSLVSESELSTENPQGISQIVDEETTLSESGPEVQAESESTSEHQQPLDTIVCVCNCGIESDLPQKCEQSLSEASTPQNENVSPMESTNDPLVPEIEKQAEDEQNGNIKTEAPLEEETSTSTLESDTHIVDEDTTEPIVMETETVAPQEIEISNATPTNNSPQEEVGPIVNNESTTDITNEVAPSAVTISEPESNPETTSNLSNPPTESTEANTQVSSEPESTITIDPLEVSSTTINPCTEVGDFSSPTSCRKYLSCSGNATNLISQELQCPERSAFNPLLRRCTRDLSPCLDEEPICLQTSSIPNPNGENSSYFWCVPSLLGGFHKYHIQCSQNEIFIPLLGRCWVEIPQLGLGFGGFGLINPEPSDRDLVRAEWKLLKREIKQKAKEEKLRKKMEEKAKARAEKLAAKELKKQKKVVRKVDDDDDDDEEENDD